MRERGTVVAVDNGLARVSIKPSTSCETCGACAEGAAGMRLLEDVLDEYGVHPGDLVEVETSAAARRRAQRLVYVVPVVAVLGGYLAGFLLGSSAGLKPDALGAVFAIGAGVLALASLKRFDRRFRRGGAQPRVRAIISRGQDGYSG